MNEKLSLEALRDELAKAAQTVEVGGRYQHYKGGTYRVADLAITEATNAVAVIYEAEYATGIRFVRPLQVWLEDVTVGGRPVPRFARIIA